MIALTSYPNPFKTAFDPECSPTCSMMLGPCHDDQAPDREDISEAESGLPMRFGLRFLTDKCEPFAGADIDIWHCDVRGVYSSETNDNPAMCSGNNQAALEKRYFRGHQRTDENGVAWFSSCFPGWYGGRALHIHLVARIADRDGDKYLTTQLGFPNEVSRDICTTHPDYKDRGAPPVEIGADGIFPADGFEKYTVDTMRMSDGALLAWKTLIVRESLDTELCHEGMLDSELPTVGAPPGGMGFPGGAPPDGGFPGGAPPDGGFPGGPPPMGT